MSKIAIVGVKGSGKSTLMAVLGEKYSSPDADGYWLDPVDDITVNFVANYTGRLRDGENTAATSPKTMHELCWKLCQNENDNVNEVCELSFLDYAGEIYPLAFGENPTEDAGRSYAMEIDRLRSHVTTADALVVLFNLSDVINSPRQKNWSLDQLTKNLVKLATDAGKREIVLVFSQVDKYDVIIDELSGLRNTYRHYLHWTSSRFPKLKLLSLSSVDKTHVDDQGNEVPAPDFKSVGLGELMSWIIATQKNVKRRAIIGLPIRLARKAAQIRETSGGKKCAVKIGRKGWGYSLLCVGGILSFMGLGCVVASPWWVGLAVLIMGGSDFCLWCKFDVEEDVKWAWLPVLPLMVATSGVIGVLVYVDIVLLHISPPWPVVSLSLTVVGLAACCISQFSVKDAVVRDNFKSLAFFIANPCGAGSALICSVFTGSLSVIMAWPLFLSLAIVGIGLTVFFFAKTNQKSDMFFVSGAGLLEIGLIGVAVLSCRMACGCLSLLISAVAGLVLVGIGSRLIARAKWRRT